AFSHHQLVLSAYLGSSSQIRQPREIAGTTRDYPRLLRSPVDDRPARNLGLRAHRGIHASSVGRRRTSLLQPAAELWGIALSQRRDVLHAGLWRHNPCLAVFK